MADADIIVDFKKNFKGKEYINRRYLNLTDGNVKYGKKFPVGGTKLIIETEGKHYKALMQTKSPQICGLSQWFDKTRVNIDDKIRIKYDPAREKINGRVVVEISVIQSDDIIEPLTIHEGEEDEKPLVEIYNQKKLELENFLLYPDEVDEKEKYAEGATKKILVNRYERDRNARTECIEKLGSICHICGFDFEKIYGEIGKGFIHVHHRIDISTIRNNYFIDPIKDLVPVCPNCHCMLHQKKPAYEIDDLKQLMKLKY